VDALLAADVARDKAKRALLEAAGFGGDDANSLAARLAVPDPAREAARSAADDDAEALLVAVDIAGRSRAVRAGGADGPLARGRALDEPAVVDALTAATGETASQWLARRRRDKAAANEIAAKVAGADTSWHDDDASAQSVITFTISFFFFAKKILIIHSKFHKLKSRVFLNS